MKIIVYGDSFVSQESNEEPLWSWPNRLAKKMNLPIINFGKSGSSSEFSFNKFVNDSKTSIVGSDDIIIFLMSSPCRLHFNYNLYNEPGLGSAFYNLSDADFNKPEYKWLKENRKHLEWYFSNINFDLNSLTHECFIHALKNFAEVNVNNTILALYNPAITSFLPLGKTPANFLFPQISLYEIQKNEQLKEYTWNEWTQYTDYDPRVNHLTNPNLNILADLAIYSIEHNTVKNWTLDKFEKNIIEVITNIPQYENYISSGILSLMPAIHDNIKTKIKK